MYPSRKNIKIEPIVSKKLVAHIGKFVRVDRATAKREKLHYARVLLEVKVDQEFVTRSRLSMRRVWVLELWMESFDVHYEWKPVVCAVCKQLGHSKKAEGRKEWRVKPEEVARPSPSQAEVMVAQDGFQAAKYKARQIRIIRSPMKTMTAENSLAALDMSKS